MPHTLACFLVALLLSVGCGAEDSDAPDAEDSSGNEDESAENVDPASGRDAGSDDDTGESEGEDEGEGEGEGEGEDESEGEGEDGSEGEGEGVSTSGPEPKIPEPSMACPALQSGTNTIMGVDVELLIGPKTDKKGPLLFNWHGTGGTGTQALSMTPQAIKDEIMAEGGMIVAPTNTTMRGTDVTLILSVWYTPGDLEVADLIVACAVQEHDIDPRRIYVTGCSAGGLMAGVMAFHRSSYVAASAPNSGGVVAGSGFTEVEDPMHVPAVMTMHGARGTDAVIVEFADTSNSLDSALVAAGGFVVNCDHGGRHCGASGELLLASWQFMKDHPFGVEPEPYASGLPATFPEYCKTFE